MEGGPPSFGPRFTGAVLLRNIIGRPERFTYGTVALYGARFHALPLRNGFLTPASLISSWADVLQPRTRNA